MTSPPDARPDNRRTPRLSKTERNERAARALRMRNGQATYAQIADTLGISEQQAKNDVTRAIKEWVRVPAEQLVDRQQAIFNDILRVEYPDAVDRRLEPAKRHAAQDKVLEVLRDERKLFGLDAPQKVTLGMSDQEFGQIAADALAVTGFAPLLELARSAPDAIDGALIEALPAVEVEIADDDEPWSNL